MYVALGIPFDARRYANESANVLLVNKNARIWNSGELSCAPAELYSPLPQPYLRNRMNVIRLLLSSIPPFLPFLRKQVDGIRASEAGRE